MINLVLLYQRSKMRLLRKTGNQFFRMDSCGTSLAFSDQGEGPAILLIHGITENASAFDSLIKRLKNRFRLIALDCRGHGDSDKPKNPKAYGTNMVKDIRNLLLHLQIDHACLLGTSMGAEIALRFTVDYPAYVTKLTVIGSGWSGETESNNYTSVGKTLQLHQSFGPWIKKTGGMGYFSADSIGIATADSMLKGQDIDALSSVFLGMSEIIQLPEEAIGNIKIPVLAICGELDEERPCLEKMNGKIEKFTIKVIPNKGHMDLADDPDYYSIIEQFLCE